MSCSIYIHTFLQGESDAEVTTDRTKNISELCEFSSNSQVTINIYWMGEV